MTRDITFKVKVTFALLTTVLGRQAAAAVGVRKCWPWETAAILPSARQRRRFGAHGGRRGVGHTVAAYSMLC